MVGVSSAYNGATGHMPQWHWDISYNSVSNFRYKEKICLSSMLFWLWARESGLGRMWLCFLPWIYFSGLGLPVSLLFSFGACQLYEWTCLWALGLKGQTHDLTFPNTMLFLCPCITAPQGRKSLDCLSAFLAALSEGILFCPQSIATFFIAKRQDVGKGTW